MKPNKMTVGELIAKLQTFDPSLLVMVDGYEGGVDYPRDIKSVSVEIGKNSSFGYFGEHEECSEHYESDEGRPVVPAILIGR